MNSLSDRVDAARRRTDAWVMDESTAKRFHAFEEEKPASGETTDGDVTDPSNPVEGLRRPSSRVRSRSSASGSCCSRPCSRQNAGDVEVDTNAGDAGR